MSQYNPRNNPRKQIRLADWDYRNEGAYFITVCTFQRGQLFGEVINGRMNLNKWGQIVVKEWKNTEKIRPYVIGDEFICMPNHIHAILWIQHEKSESKRIQSAGEDSENNEVVKAQSLSAIIRGFKSAVTQQINLERNEKHPPIWQSRFYDRIIRNERELNAVRHYIKQNPSNWATDQDNGNITINSILTQHP